MKAFIERFEGTAVLTDERDIASQADADGAIDALDGRITTSVSFETETGPKLMVSGGPGGYLASTWDDDAEESWTARRAGDPTPGEVEIISAGQAVTVPAAQVLSRQDLGPIVAHFVAGRGRTADIDWQLD